MLNKQLLDGSETNWRFGYILSVTGLTLNKMGVQTTCNSSVNNNEMKDKL